MRNRPVVGVVTQSGKGIPNNDFNPQEAILRQPSTKPAGMDMLSKYTQGSAHTVSQLPRMRKR